MASPAVTLAAWISVAALVSFSLGVTMHTRYKAERENVDQIKVLATKIYNLELDLTLMKVRIADLEKESALLRKKGGK